MHYFCIKELDKYECLSGEDLGYKPEVLEKTKSEYSPLGETFNEIFLKNDKISKGKYDNDLRYGFVHNFNKFSMSNFNEISSINSKFDTLNKLYKDFKKLNDVKSQNKNKK